jgi:beta-mannanase
MPWGEPYWESGFQEDYSLSKIINGNFDDFLTDWAEVVKNFGEPVFVTFGVEMNGNWFPWSGIFQGAGNTGEFGDSLEADGPEKFKLAFRHIIDIFNEQNVQNAIWYFHVTNKSFPDETWNEIINYYPGDNYIDWIGVSVYGAQYNDENWVTFDEEMQNIYAKLTITFPNKPLMLAEWGVKEP